MSVRKIEESRDCVLSGQRALPERSSLACTLGTGIRDIEKMMPGQRPEPVGIVSANDSAPGFSRNTLFKLLVNCPCCKRSFTPRTVTQSVCGLACFYAMKRGGRTVSEPIVLGASIVTFRAGAGQTSRERADDHRHRIIATSQAARDTRSAVAACLGQG